MPKKNKGDKKKKGKGKMPEKPRRLGKGLGALIENFNDDTQNETASVIFQEISVEAVRTNAKQPRQIFDDSAINELAESIREVGLLQPIVVRIAQSGYELIAGERRLRAVQQLGLEKIPALIRKTVDDDLLREALLENIQRVQLNPLEEAAAYKQLLVDFGCSQDELGRKLGKSRPHIANMIRLLKLPTSIQNKIASGMLTAGHARAILSVESETEQEMYAQKVVSEGLSVRSIEELIALGGIKAVKEGKKKFIANVIENNIGERKEIEDMLSEVFDTSAKVMMGSKKGKLLIEFADKDDLNRIIEIFKTLPVVKGK